MTCNRAMWNIWMGIHTTSYGTCFRVGATHVSACGRWRHDMRREMDDGQGGGTSRWIGGKSVALLGKTCLYSRLILAQCMNNGLR